MCGVRIDNRGIKFSSSGLQKTATGDRFVFVREDLEPKSPGEGIRPFDDYVKRRKRKALACAVGKSDTSLGGFYTGTGERLEPRARVKQA